MKRLAFMLSVVAVVGFLVSPVWAGSPGPSADQLLKDLYGKKGEAVPQVTDNYLCDFVSNAYSFGWGSVFCLTNYNSMVRNRVEGYVVQRGTNPGDELNIDEWLNPYEVKYIDLADLGLGDDNGWAFLTSSIADFGCGVLLFNTTPEMPGMTWVKPWYWVTN